MNDLITKKSWFFFQIFHIDLEFLYKNADVWLMSDTRSYQEGLVTVA